MAEYEDMTTHPRAVLRPRLVVSDAAKAIDWYRDVFEAEEVERYADGGSIVHAELKVGAARWTLKDQDGVDRSPTPDGGYPILLMLDLPNLDTVVERMTAGGATVIFPVEDRGYGRGGRLRDPFGHVWMLSEAQPTQG